MIVNGKNFDINELMKSIDTNSNELQKVGNFTLTKREIEILERNFIEYKTCSSLRDLMLKIQYELENDDLDNDSGDELDFVLEQINERDYYTNINK